MPIYEYRCSACGHELEALQKFSDAPLSICPSCNANALVKLMSAAGFQLKGSGWYVTDFKGGGAKPASKKADAESKGETKSEDKGNGATTEKSETKGETKSDSKPETKSETKAESKSTPPASGTGTPSTST